MVRESGHSGRQNGDGTTAHEQGVVCEGNAAVVGSISSRSSSNKQAAAKQSKATGEGGWARAKFWMS
jgi:hypothetical protein